MHGGGSGGGGGGGGTAVAIGGTTSKEMQLMRDSLEQQTLQTRQALTQLMVVREQLIAETNARIEAQVHKFNFNFADDFNGEQKKKFIIFI